jgi:1-phosphatidylinositol-4-phosphate 5-kinase
MMHGYGEFRWTNGQMFKGYYDRDKKQGEGVLVLGDGTVIQAVWVKGKIHGKGKVTKKSGEVKIVEWDMGVEKKTDNKENN